jgi:hypothetical protein
MSDGHDAPPPVTDFDLSFDFRTDDFRTEGTEPSNSMP